MHLPLRVDEAPRGLGSRIFQGLVPLALGRGADGRCAFTLHSRALPSTTSRGSRLSRPSDFLCPTASGQGRSPGRPRAPSSSLRWAAEVGPHVTLRPLAIPALHAVELARHAGQATPLRGPRAARSAPSAPGPQHIDGQMERLPRWQRGVIYWRLVPSKYKG